MKKVCGTCIFNIDSKPRQSCIMVLCAYDNSWREDKTEGCSNWQETSTVLTNNDRIDLANKLKDEQNKEKHYKEILEDSKISRRNQILLGLLCVLLSIFGALISKYIWLLWIK